MGVPCDHWRDCGLTGGGCCAIGRYHKPSVGICMRWCDSYEGPARGAGDRLAYAIKLASVGLVRPCKGCKDRQRKMNGWKPSKAAREMQEV